MCGIFAVISDNPKYKKSPKRSLVHRGPDDFMSTEFGNCYMEFWRLAINGLTEDGMQPMQYKDSVMVCNGEVYNYLELGGKRGQSDCAIIQPLIENSGILKAVDSINGDFAFVWSDGDKFYAARDRVGVRPLFYTHLPCGGMAFASEAKALTHFDTCVHHFPPGHIYDSEFDDFICYAPMYYTHPPKYNDDWIESAVRIHDKLVDAVKLRFETTDRPVGFFLSGGLDSSIIAAIGARLSKDPIRTFSIGFDGCDSPDLIAARKVAKHIGSKHTEVKFTLRDGINALNDVIYHLETYDTTTIRASVPMYLLSKHIAENTDIRVILSGEGSDELFGGYLYFHYAPGTDEFVKETTRLLRDVHLFDVLRADRCTSAHGLELRVPFFDPDFIEYVMDGFAGHMKMPMDEMLEKEILRSAFHSYLPKEIIRRQKNGMSDAVGYNWVDGIKEYANTTGFHWVYKNPEEKLYKNIFFMHDYPWSLVLYKWMPKWTNATDPSARYLAEFNDKTKKEPEEPLFGYKEKCMMLGYALSIVASIYTLSKIT
jgi:asparagine synthase (glutamine-hydrolysing)